MYPSRLFPTTFNQEHLKHPDRTSPRLHLHLYPYPGKQSALGEEDFEWKTVLNVPLACTLCFVFPDKGSGQRCPLLAHTAISKGRPVYAEAHFGTGGLKVGKVGRGQAKMFNLGKKKCYLTSAITKSQRVHTDG